MPRSLYKEFLKVYEKIVSYENPDDALYALLEEIALSLNSEKVLLALHYPSQKVLKATSPSYGVEKSELLKLFIFSLDRKSALQEALKNRDLYFTNDALNDPFFIKEFILAFEVDRVMILPVFDSNGKLYAAVYADGTVDFKEKEIKISRNWMRILYPLISYIMNLKKTYGHFLSSTNLLNIISHALSENDPETSILTFIRSILNQAGLCTVSIFLKKKHGEQVLVEEKSVTNKDCFEPQVVKTIKREIPLSADTLLLINLSYNSLTYFSRYTHSILNMLSFLSIYLLRNREKNNINLKISLIKFLSDAVNNVTTEKELADTVTKMLFEYGHYEDVSYLKYRRSQHKLELFSQFTIIGMSLYTTYEQSADIGLLGMSVREKDIVFANDTQQNKQYYLGFPERKIFQAEIALPLLYDGEVVSVLNIETTRKNSFDEEEISFLKSIKHIIEAKLSHVLFLEEVAKERKRLKILNGLIESFSPKEHKETFLKNSISILQDGFGDNYVFYYTTFKNGIISLKRHDGPTIEIPKEEQKEEMLKAFTSKSISLLVFGGYSSIIIPFSECKERLALFIQKRSGKLQDSTIQFLRLAANLICSLRHNSQLYKEVDMRLKEIGFLYNFSREIKATKTREELFEKTYELVKSLFNIEDFYIALYSSANDSIYLEIDYDGDVKQRKRIIPLSKAQGLTAWIIKQKRPVIINDWDKEAYSYPIVPLGNKSHSSYIGLPLVADERSMGVIALQSPRRNFFSGHTLSLLSTIATQLSMTISNIDNLDKLKSLIKRLENTYQQTLEALSHALDYREKETEYHSKRVASYALLLAKEYGVKDEEKLRYIYWGGLLHDIGKIGIPDRILLKPGKLDKDEWTIMKKHVLIGYQIIKGIKFLSPALPLILHHHEWWNGKGYPMGLKGRDIPVEARIFSVIDAFDAMTSDRPYRKAMSYQKAITELQRMSEIQFDPEVVKTFLKIPFKKLSEINPHLKKK